MPRSRQQSSLRYPLTGILANETQVRLLRQLARHGGAQAAPALVRRTDLAASSAHQGLGTLDRLGIVDVLGSGRARLHRLRREHPLAAALDELFASEENRFASIGEAVREAALRCRPGLLALWLYGSVARGADGPRSDLDLVAVCEPGERARISSCLLEGLRGAQNRLDFTAALVSVDTDDVLRHEAEQDTWWLAVVEEARSLVGDPPDTLLPRLRRAARQKA